MRKRLPYIASFIGLVLAATFIANSKSSDYRKLGRSFFAAIGLQNATSSQDAASSTSSNASTTSAISTLTLMDALQQFQDQIQSLNNRMVDLGSEIETINLRSIFTKVLKRGDTGNDVSKLQELLMRFREFYPSDSDTSSTVTGFYGSFTKAAVIQFQSQAGLKETGVFDFATREKFYESLSALAQESTSTEFTPVDISSIAEFNNSSESQNKTSTDIEGSLTDLQNQVSQLASDSTSTQTNIADLQNQASQLSSDLASVKSEIADLQNQLAALQPAQAPAPSPAPASPPPAPKLAISNVQVTKITQQSATITWTTNSSSTSEVDYSTDTNLLASKTSIVSSSTAVTNHAAGIQNLNSGTKYYYRVLSKDNNNITASSTIQNFTTLN